MKTGSTRKNRWLVTLMAVVMPGLGQFANGEPIKGGSLLVFFIFIPLLICWTTVHLPDRFLFSGVGLAAMSALGVYIFAIVDAVKSYGRGGESRAFSYRNGFFSLAFWLVGMACIVASDGYLKANVVHPYKIVGRSMEPQVLRGDYVLVDKTAYRKHTVRRGDIVIHIYPDDRSKVFIRKVLDLPGDTYVVNGQKIVVPHGEVIMGGKKDLLDSQDYGPVDMRDIVGQVKQIYFSYGPDGIRWNRIGKLVSSNASTIGNNNKK